MATYRLSRHARRASYRSFPTGEYLIFHRIAEPGVCVMRVVHGRRDLAALFNP